MSRDEMIAAFSLDGISGGDAVFNPEKLDWFNAPVSRAVEPRTTGRAREAAAEAAGLWNDELDDDGAGMAAARAACWCCRACGGCRNSSSQAAPFLAAAVEYDPEAVRKHLTRPISTATSKRSSPRFERTPSRSTKPAIERVLRGVADARGIKAAR